MKTTYQVFIIIITIISTSQKFNTSIRTLAPAQQMSQKRRQNVRQKNCRLGHRSYVSTLWL